MSGDGADRPSSSEADAAGGLLAFTVLFAGLFLLRYALENLRDAADARERRATA